MAPSLKFEWGLWQILANRPKTARIDLVGAKLDIERRPDGTIDLQETLKPVTPEHPTIQIVIHLEDSHVRLRDPLLGEPFLAEDLDVHLDMSRGYEPISWQMSMAPPEPQGQSGRLELEGNFSRARIDRSGRHDTQVTLKATNWPFAVSNSKARLKCQGVLDGMVDADLQSSLWLARGETKLTGLELRAPVLTETVRLDTVSAGWDVKGKESAWTVDRLSLESSLLSVRAEGSVPAVAKRGAWLEANLNLADLARYLPIALRSPDGIPVERGSARLRADLKAGVDGVRQICDVRGTVSDVNAVQGPRVLTVAEANAADAQREQSDDVLVSVHASFDPPSGQLDLSKLALTLPFVHVEGAGVVRHTSGTAQLSLEGKLNPDWRALTALLGERVEPNARIAGQPRPWRISASIASLSIRDALETISGEFGVQIDELDVFGMRLGNSAVVARAEQGTFRIDPIDATLNEGTLHVEPKIERDGDGHRWLRLGESSHLDGAVINDEVSHRVLSYAAPVLDGATRVKGRISARLNEATFPIMATPGAGARATGDLILDNVRFVPGRLAGQLLGIFDKEDLPLLTLRDSISVRIEDRKVHQKGMVIAVADVASITLDGSVDFDKNLDLVAGIAMNRSTPIAGVLPPALQNARVDIPIRGTMQNPRIDSRGFRDRLAEMGADLFGNSVEAGLDGLQRLMGGKSLKGLGDYFLPRARPMTPSPDAEDADPKPKGPGRQHTVPADPELGPNRTAPKDHTDGSSE
jgi:hypothetical protein